MNKICIARNYKAKKTINNQLFNNKQKKIKKTQKKSINNMQTMLSIYILTYYVNVSENESEKIYVNHQCIISSINE